MDINVVEHLILSTDESFCYSLLMNDYYKKILLTNK